MANYKRILAVSLAATMLMGSSAVVFAADKEASSSGEGETQYVSESDVFDVIFPTVAENATTFDYLLDPDGLIAETKGDRYTGKAFDDDKTVYFLRSAKVDGTVDGTAGTKNCDYTDKSDEIKVVNKSTEAVDLKVSAKVTDVPSEIKMAAAKTFAGTDTELYLGLMGTDGATPTEKAISAAGVELTASIAADAAAYETKWDASANGGKGAYVKSLTTAAQAADYAGFKSYSFQLTGVCNTAEGTDWSGLTDKAPKVDLTWSVKDFTVTGPQVTFNSNGLISITNLTAEQNFASLKIVEQDGTEWPLGGEYTADESDWSRTEGGNLSVQLGNAWKTHLAGQTASISVTLSDGSTKTASATFATE